MKWYQNALLVFAVVCLVVSCDLRPNRSITASDQAFLDLDSLLTAQVKALAGLTVVKTVEQSGQQEQKTIALDSAGWQDELGVFDDINISKPAYVGAYSSIESAEGLSTEFTRKPDEKGGPLAVKIQRNSEGRLTEISGELVKENVLYQAKKVYVLKFNEGTGLLSSYEFSGHQKLAAKDQVSFRISGQL